MICILICYFFEFLSSERGFFILPLASNSHYGCCASLPLLKLYFHSRTVSENKCGVKNVIRVIELHIFFTFREFGIL